MKKILTSTAILIMILLFASCSKTPESGDSSTMPNDIPASQVTSGTDNEYKMESYKNAGIDIEYPAFLNISGSEQTEKVNELIKQSALRDIDALSAEESAFEYVLKASVTLNSPDILSIKFEGYQSYESAAHPNAFLYTINIDVKKLETIKLTELINISEGYIELLKNSKFYQLDTEITDSEYQEAIRTELNELDASSFTDADTDKSFIASYLTADSLVVSIPVPHVMGDYIEIPVKYSELSGFKSDNGIWKSIAQ